MHHSFKNLCCCSAQNDQQVVLWPRVSDNTVLDTHLTHQLPPHLLVAAGLSMHVHGLTGRHPLARYGGVPARRQKLIGNGLFCRGRLKTGRREYP